MRPKMRLQIVGLSILAGLAGLVAGPVHAAIHEGSDILGLATSPDGNGEFSLIDPATGPFDLHLLVYGFEHSQLIVGWECQVLLPAGVEISGVTLNGKADPAGVDLGTGNLRAFPLIPLPVNDGIVHLATLHLNLTELLDNQDFRLAPYVEPTPNPVMSFSLETSGSNHFAFEWPGSCASCPVFRIDATPEATIELSWDHLKSLYR